MNYKQIYENLIKKRQRHPATKAEFGYIETHHIIPKSLNGTNDKENLINLTAREHYIAHELLFKIYQDSNDYKAAYKMANAFILMHKFAGSMNKENNRFSNIKYNSRIYEAVKKSIKSSPLKRRAVWNIKTNRQKFIVEGDPLPDGYTFETPIEIKEKYRLISKQNVLKAKKTFKERNPGLNSPTENKRLVHNVKTNKQYYKDLIEPLASDEILGENNKNKERFKSPSLNKKWVTNIKTLEFKLIGKNESLEEDYILGRLEKSKKEYLLKLSDDDRWKILNEMQKKGKVIKSFKTYDSILNKEKYDNGKKEKLKYYEMLYDEYKINGMKGVKEKFNYAYSRINLYQQFRRYGFLEKKNEIDN